MNDRQIIVKALKAIASAFSFCDTDMELTLRDRLNTIHEAIEELANDDSTPKNDVDDTEVDANDADAASVSFSSVTETENADSRAKLEADAFNLIAQMVNEAYSMGEREATWTVNRASVHERIASWLNRQAAITERETLSHPDERDEQIAELQQQVGDLTAERDELKAFSERLETAAHAKLGVTLFGVDYVTEDFMLHVRDTLMAERDEWKAKAESALHENPYVGLVRGKQWERTEISDYYCGRCGWKVTDHDSYCSECGGALHKASNKPDSKFDARKIAETSETDAAKNEICNFDDTREKLEEDCEKLIRSIQRRTFSGRDAGALRYQLKELLDRQAAITRAEFDKPGWEYCETCEEIARLRVESMNLAHDLGECMADRDRYRALCGQMLDAAHEIRRIADANMPEVAKEVLK